MRVRFQNSDGLVFLSRVKPPITLDSALLAQTEREDLEQLVQAARFFELPEQTPSNLNGGAAWPRIKTAVAVRPQASRKKR